MGGQQYDGRSGQLIPLPASEMSSLEKLDTSMQVSAPLPEKMTYVTDKTVMFVSPLAPPLTPPATPPTVP
jgi:hypothetical protein